MDVDQSSSPGTARRAGRTTPLRNTASYAALAVIGIFLALLLLTLDLTTFVLVVVLSIPTFAVVAYLAKRSRERRTPEEHAARIHDRMARRAAGEDPDEDAPGRVSLNRATRLRKTRNSWTGRW